MHSENVIPAHIIVHMHAAGRSLRAQQTMARSSKREHMSASPEDSLPSAADSDPISENSQGAASLAASLSSACSHQSAVKLVPQMEKLPSFAPASAAPMLRPVDSAYNELFHQLYEVPPIWSTTQGLCHLVSDTLYGLAAVVQRVA